MQKAAPNGWYRDPSGRHASRWWDGYKWGPWVDGSSTMDRLAPGEIYPSPPGIDEGGAPGATDDAWSRAKSWILAGLVLSIASVTLALINLWKALEISADWDQPMGFLDAVGYGTGAGLAQLFAWVFSLMGAFAVLFALIGVTKSMGSSKLIVIGVVAVVLGIATVALSVAAWLIVQSLD
jgi:hypothetical protein